MHVYSRTPILEIIFLQQEWKESVLDIMLKNAMMGLWDILQTGKKFLFANLCYPFLIGILLFTKFILQTVHTTKSCLQDVCKTVFSENRN
jgi:hypothetical protein